jgi:hypothetical protein
MVEHTRRYITIENKNSNPLKYTTTIVIVVATVVTGYNL